MNARVKVGCGNWSHPAAPKALAYAVIDGEMRGDRFFATWAEAIEYASNLAVRLRRLARQERSCICGVGGGKHNLHDDLCHHYRDNEDGR